MFLNFHDFQFSCHNPCPIVVSLEKLKDFGECVIALQASVIKKFLQGFMAPKQKKRKLQSEDSTKSEEVDEEKKMVEEAKVLSC